MPITINNVEWTWFIRRVSVKKTHNNLSNVITSASWSLKAEYIDLESKDQYAEEYLHVTELDFPNETNFIEYDNITNDIVISWIEIIESEKLNLIKEEIISKLNQEYGEEVTMVLKSEI